MASDSGSPIDRLPKELLRHVLIQIRNASGVSRSDLLSCLRVCKHWHDATLSLLYHDIRLTTLNLESFNARFDGGHGLLIRSLTIVVYSPFAIQNGASEQPPSTMEEMDDIKRHGTLETRRLWTRLEKLSQRIRSMSNLTTFSLIVAPEALRDGFWLPRPSIASLLKELPEGCQSVEVDTRSQDHCSPGSAHLCDVIRGRLPRLKHLRLYTSTVCQAMFGTGPAPGNDPQKVSEYRPVDAPFLQTVLVNCLAGSLYHRQARVCGTCEEKLFGFSSRDGEEARFVLTKCMRAIVEQAKCPKNARLLVFDAQTGDHEDQSVYPAFNLRDVVENVTYTQPFNNIYPMDDHSFLLRTYGRGEEDVLSTAQAIQELAEGRTWKKTTNGFRFPSPILQEQTGAMGYVIKQLPLQTVEAWKADHPRKSCLLWVNEKKTGLRLLEAVRQDGIHETTPIKEQTPCGWERDGADLMRVNT